MHVHIFKLYTVCVCLYIHNKYTQYTHILYIMQTKTFILDVINRLNENIYSKSYIYIYMVTL